MIRMRPLQKNDLYKRKKIRENKIWREREKEREEGYENECLWCEEWNESIHLK